MEHNITVTTTVNVDGKERTFTAKTSTDGDAWRAARNTINTVAGDAGGWTDDERYAKDSAEPASASQRQR